MKHFNKKWTFEYFLLICGATSPHQIPYMVSHHGFFPPPLIALLHHLDVMVKPFTMLFAYIPQVIPKDIQVRIQKMQLQGHAATKLFITFNQISHHHCIVVSSMISKKSFHNHCKSLPSISLQIRHLFLQLFGCQHSSYLWFHQYTTFTFASDMLGNISLIRRKTRLVGFKAITNCLASPSLICNGGSKVLLLSIRDEFRKLWDPGVRSLQAGLFLIK